MTKYSNHFNPTVTPQSEQADPRQKENSAGGFSFVASNFDRLDRFLVLGADGGSYYATEREMTRENAKTLLECLREDWKRTVDRIVQMSDEGRIPKNETAIFALALCASSDIAEARSYACTVMPKVCRTGTHMFQFVSTVENFRGWGRTLKRAVSEWYNSKSPEQLGYQVVKYQNREKWSHRDVLRKAHVEAKSAEHNAVLRYCVSGAEGLGAREVLGKATKNRSYAASVPVPALLSGYEALKKASSVKEVVSLIETFGFTHEMIPTEWKKEPDVWAQLLPKMPITALVRNLNKLTICGLTKPLSKELGFICEKLTNEDLLRKGRVHPIQMLSALKTYSQGRGDKGSLTWVPERRVVDALNDGFYASFKTTEPTGKNLLLAVDCSGSMFGGNIAGIQGLTPAEGAACMAMLFAKTEKNWHCVGYGSNSLIMLQISPKNTLDETLRYMQGVPWGGTDCSLPCLYATEKKLDVDAFINITDSETWAGRVHPHQALAQYRKSCNKPKARLACISMVANWKTIADPSDPYQLEMVGFDSAAPQILSEFIKD